MKRQILFVDDDANFLSSIRRMLRTQLAEWNLTFAHSADEAMKLASEAEFDVVVMDVQMPGKDGLALLEELRTTPTTADVPVVMLTGRADAALKRQALDLGATDLLDKPAEREDLVARVRSCLRIKRYQDELKAQNERLDRTIQERTSDLEFSRIEIILRLAKAAEFRDEETGNHVIRVGCYARLLAEQLGMDGAAMQMLLLAAPLHDIGKIGIPDEILLKPGKLTKEEWETMKRHCVIGAEILLHDPKAVDAFMEWQSTNAIRADDRPENPVLHMASVIAASHHEKWDGSGYPQGLSGEAIPIDGLIVALADVYDALRSERPYKRAMSPEKAVEVIQEGVGQHFSPEVAAAFELVREEFEAVRERFRDAPDMLLQVLGVS